MVEVIGVADKSLEGMTELDVLPLNIFVKRVISRVLPFLSATSISDIMLSRYSLKSSRDDFQIPLVAFLRSADDIAWKLLSLSLYKSFVRLLTCRFRNRVGLRVGRTALAASKTDSWSALRDSAGSDWLMDLLDKMDCTLLSYAVLRAESDLSVL